MVVFVVRIVFIFRTENKLEKVKKYVKKYFHEKVCKNKDSYGIAMLSQKANRLQFNIIYADLECLIKKIDGCANNPEK